MSGTLTRLNLGGVLALAVLCVVQWRANLKVNQDYTRLERVRLEQAGRIAEAERRIAGQGADLESLRRSLSRVGDELRSAEAGRAEARRTADSAAAELEGLRHTLKKWAEAVEARDAQLAQAEGELRDRTDRANEAVRRFNELAARHEKLSAELNERTREYNEIAARSAALGGK